MRPLREKSHIVTDLAEKISDRSVRALFLRCVGMLGDLHEDVRLQTTSLEVRAFYRDHPLCRLVPYRELIHFQVGETPAWEMRVRGEPSFLDTFDQILTRFLRIQAALSEQ